MNDAPAPEFLTATRELLLAQVEADEVRSRTRWRSPKPPWQTRSTSLPVQVVAGALCVLFAVALFVTLSSNHEPHAGSTGVGISRQASPTPRRVASAAPTAAPTGPLTARSAIAEYKAAIASIPEPLPDGRAYPPELPAGFVPGPGGALEAGAATNQAWLTWICAWESDYLTTKSGTERARASEMIEHWPSMWWYQNALDDPEHGWVTNVIDPLKRGDGSGVAADYHQACATEPTVPR